MTTRERTLSLGLITLAAIAVGGCGSPRGDGTGGGGGGAASSTSSSTGTGSACSVATPEGCLYAPTAVYEEGIAEEVLTEPDAIGGPRDVPVAYHIPKGATGPLPIVILSHGGATGHTDPTTSLNEWASVFTRAGYFTVSIAHVPASDAQRAELCASLGVADCTMFKYLNWYRPHDIARVLDRLEEVASKPSPPAELDLTRIAIAGHSAGAGATMMEAGASREYIPGMPTVFDDPRPIAFLTYSPQGPGSEGFTESSFGAISRPLLLGTGAGDDTEGDTPETRIRPFDLMPPGDKFKIFIDDVDALHTVFEHKTDNCEKSATPERCAQFLSWLDATALAFVDTYLRGDERAAAYLRSQDVAVASSGVAQWTTK
ncbi:MAG: hypothetical protein U0414_19925 [Polyangiaceae bacterium]